jgi:hypothetical protein
MSSDQNTLLKYTVDNNTDQKNMVVFQTIAMGGIGTYGYHPLIVYFCATISSRVFNL